MSSATGITRIVEDVRGLDINNLGAWPRWVYVVCILLLVSALGYAGFHYLIKPKQEELRISEARELSLRKEFEKKQKKVANLDAYREQLNEMERRFGKMLRQLPSKSEIANLLTDISHTRAAAGLDEELFQPLAEAKRDFYAEVPTKMVVVGNYHQLATFISGISSMPRIVTVHNVNITPKKQAKLKGNDRTISLRMTLIAKTYRYLDDSDLYWGRGRMTYACPIRRHCLRNVIAGMFVLVLLAGCDRGMSDLDTYVAEVKARKSSDIEPIPEVHVFAPFIYDPADRRDPFLPLEFSLQGPPIVSSGIRPDTTRNREPLEAFPLDALSMVGTLQTQSTMFALIRGGDGIVHRITLGNYMGQQFGKITGISEQKVEIIEIVQDGFGGYMEQPNHLTLID